MGCVRECGLCFVFIMGFGVNAIYGFAQTDESPSISPCRVIVASDVLLMYSLKRF